MTLPEGFRLAAILEREDPRDCIVSPSTGDLARLPEGAVVGTSSLRREAQLRRMHPRLKVAPLRGNLDTRLAKLDRGEYGAIVLAAAGLRRLGLASRIRRVMDIDECLPAPGQGALAIEILDQREDLASMVAPLQHALTAAGVRAERAVSRALGGSCQLPLGAYAHGAGPGAHGERLVLHAMVADPSGTRIVRAQMDGAAEAPELLGEMLARALRAQGADEILASLR